MIVTTQHYESAAHLCASLRVPYARIAKAIETLKLKPAITLNGIAHYTDEQTELIAQHVSKGKVNT